MNEETHRKWDIGLKVAAPIITVLGLLVGVWQYTHEQKEQLVRQYKLIAENDRLEFKRRLWEKQLETYLHISNIVGKIAGGDQSEKEFKESINQFNTAYWGAMIYAEDAAVEKAMIEFNLEIQDYLNKESDKTRLKQRALAVVQACKQSSRNQWFAEQVGGKE
jgi:hypothetical protein